MPKHNRFHHQQYTSAAPSAPYRLIPNPAECHPTSRDYEEELAAACGPCAGVNLVGVFLVHGTFTGNDPLGLLTELQRLSPTFSEQIRRFTKGCVDAVVGETGNYTRQFADTLARGFQNATRRQIPVKLHHWSSQNNHIARADGAVRLLLRLAKLVENLPQEKQPSAAHVLLWGHSHGGNVLAIITNLLAADEATRQEFFDAARIFFSTSGSGRVDMPAWQQVEAILADRAHPLHALQLDIVTFGTPIRYGWETNGYSKLMHFVNHRPQSHLPEYLTGHPLRLLSLILAREGDYIHQIGIAGTNIPPIPLALRTFLADRRIKMVLERELPWEWLLTKFSRGQRVPAEATTLLVDYHDMGLNPFHLAGHAAYTRRKWLPFQMNEVCKAFYPG